MAHGSSMKKYIEAKDLPAYFRALADAFEKGSNDEFDCIDDFKKFKITGRNEFGKITLKTKFKTMQECDPPEDIKAERDALPKRKPRYKDLKKRMRSSFNMLLKMIHDGEMPPAEAVESFLGDSELMVTYTGYGDEFYDEYTKTCESFRVAYEARDMTKMHEAIDALIHEKSRCHAKYD